MYRKLISSYVKNSKYVKTQTLKDLLTKNPIVPYPLKKANEEQTVEYLKTNLEYTESIMGVLNEQGSVLKINLNSVFQSYWGYILPFYKELMEIRAKQSRSVFLGALGVQGAGKTTFGSIINAIAKENGKSICTISTDDFYLPFADRKALRERDPRYRWRGPPITHDLPWLQKVCNQIMNGEAPIQVPRFDKSCHKGEGDRVETITFQQIPDIFILDGWFVGLRPYENEEELKAKFLPPIVTEEDQQYALDNNKKLREFEPIWDKFDKFLLLSPEKYEYSKMWRLEAEHKMKAKKGHGMSDQQIEEFVNYFWKSLHPKIFVEDVKNKKIANISVLLDAKHSIKDILV